MKHHRKDHTNGTASSPPLARPDRRYVASLVDKRWDLLAEYKIAAVRAEKAFGILHALRTMDALYASARFWQPTWPTERDREEDLEAHRRVAAALARTKRIS